MTFSSRNRHVYNQEAEVLRYQRMRNEGLFTFEQRLLEKYLSPYAHVCVVGCACGREIPALISKNCFVVGLDHAESMLRSAKDHSLHQKALRPFFCAAESERIPFASGTFDTILLFNILNDIPLGKNEEKSPDRSAVRCLEECRRVLKNDGVLILWVWKREHWESVLYLDILSWIFNSWAGGGRQESRGFSRAFWRYWRHRRSDSLK